MTTERLVDRYLRDEVLAQVPLHPNQHSYQAVKSVETALHLVVRVEKAFGQQQTALGVFLDIDGAFNKTCYGTIYDALVRYWVGYTIVRWILATLQGRVVAVTLSGSSVRVGYPEGPRRGVCCHRTCGALWWMI
jgi:hypothetical protein